MALAKGVERIPTNPPLLESETVPDYLPFEKVEDDTPPITTSSSGANVNFKSRFTFALESELQIRSPGDTFVGLFVMKGSGSGGLGIVMNFELWEMKRNASHFSLFLVDPEDFALELAPSFSSLGAFANSGARGLFSHPF